MTDSIVLMSLLVFEDIGVVLRQRWLGESDLVQLLVLEFDRRMA